jgi:hypothetical protein
MTEQSITESFAKELLQALHDLDQPLGRLMELSRSSGDPKLNEKLDQVFFDLCDGLTVTVMRPIYKAVPSLGRPSEPGDWYVPPQNVI